jgi:glycosyltransferase involved in cell wall biosynthesis
MTASHPSAQVLWTKAFWSNYGTHNGLVPLSAAVQKAAPGLIRLVGPVESPRPVLRLAQRAVRKINGLMGKGPSFEAIHKHAPFYGETGWLLEKAIRASISKMPPAVLMIESLEESFFSLAEERPSWTRTRLLGICHQPPTWWRLKTQGAPHFRALDRLIVLSKEAQIYWSDQLGAEKVVFIPHGANVDFFKPGPPGGKPSVAEGALQIVFSGSWLRDFETLETVIALADQRRLPVRFDLVVPLSFRDRPAFYELTRSSRVRWHAGLSEEGLREVYQKSDLMLHLLRDSTANNGMLEGMACGLPLIVTDVGGVRDYARENFADFIPPRDAHLVVQAIEYWIDHCDELPYRGDLARAHTVDHFAWDKIAECYVELIREVMAPPNSRS